MHQDHEATKATTAKIAKDKARALRAQATHALEPLRAALLRRAGELELIADALLLRDTADVVLLESAAPAPALATA